MTSPRHERLLRDLAVGAGLKTPSFSGALTPSPFPSFVSFKSAHIWYVSFLVYLHRPPFQVIIPRVVLRSSFSGPCRLGSELGYLSIDNLGEDLQLPVWRPQGHRHSRSADATRRGDRDFRSSLSRKQHQHRVTTDPRCT